MGNIATSIFQMSSWSMKTPAPYSAFHILFGGAGILTAIYLAWNMSKKQPFHVLFFCGLILAASELYKQGFLYYIVNGQQYDWWYFPFQLCSMPIYLCLLLPRLKKGRRTVVTFLADFALLGGIAVYLDPSDMLSPSVFLTLFSFLWHELLIVIGILCGTSDAMEEDFRGALKMLGLFGLLAGIAEMLNVTLSRYGELPMFYLSPKLANTQLGFREIARLWGIPAGNFCYFLAMIAGGLLIHTLWRRIRQKDRSIREQDV